MKLQQRILREKIRHNEFTDLHIDYELNIHTGDKLRFVTDNNGASTLYVYDTEWKFSKDKVVVYHYIEKVDVV